MAQESNEGLLGVWVDEVARTQLNLDNDYTIRAVTRSWFEIVPFDEIEDALRADEDDDCYGDLLSPEEVAVRLEPIKRSVRLPDGFWLVGLKNTAGHRVDGVIALTRQQRDALIEAAQTRLADRKSAESV